MPDQSFNPLISIVIATYNGEKYIDEQLRSVISQDYPNIEIIVVDDASTDQTTAIVHTYSSKCPFLKLYVNETNIGYIKNFEKGLLLTNGQFVALCDQDDVWEPHKLTMQMAAIGKHPLLYTDALLIDENGTPMHRRLSDIKHLAGFNDCLNYAIGNSAPGHSMLIKKEILQQCIPFPAIFPHDYWIGFVATLNGAIKYLDIPLVRYRQHNNNIFGAGKMVNAVKRRKNVSKPGIHLTRQRMRLLYDKCPEHLPQKSILSALNKSYRSFSLSNNFKRSALFIRHYDKILAYKKKPKWKKLLFCVKMFFMIK